MLVIVISGVSIVNTTESTEGDLEQNKALRVDSELEKMWAVIMISWIIVYVNGKKIFIYLCLSLSLNLFFLKIELMVDFIKSQDSQVDFWHGL